MRSFFIIVTVAIAISSSFAQAGDRSASRTDCGSRCNLFKHTQDVGLKAAVPGQVCFNYVQAQPAPTELMFYRSYNPATKTGVVSRKIKHKNAGRSDQYCVGSKYVREAVAVEICDEATANSIRGLPSLRLGLETKVVEMCLLGEACPRFVRQ